MWERVTAFSRAIPECPEAFLVAKPSVSTGPGRFYIKSHMQSRYFTAFQIRLPIRTLLTKKDDKNVFHV